jgi:hypothetical protein
LYSILPFRLRTKGKSATATVKKHEITEGQSPRTACLEARITEEQKDLLSKAAALLGCSLPDFVVTCAHYCPVDWKIHV